MSNEKFRLAMLEKREEEKNFPKDIQKIVKQSFFHILGV